MASFLRVMHAQNKHKCFTSKFRRCKTTPIHPLTLLAKIQHYAASVQTQLDAAFLLTVGSLLLTVQLNSWESPDQPEESFGPFGPEVSRRVSDRVSPKMGVSERVSHGLSPGPEGPRAPECQKGVPRVSNKCPDTPGTLSGHL